MTRPKSLADKYPNWSKRFSDVPVCSTAVVTMFLAYASYVPADKAKKVGGPSDGWEISFKEAYDALSDAATSDAVKKHVSSLNTFIQNFCLMSSSTSTFENPDGAPDINAYMSAGFPKTALESLYPSYTTKAEAKEWLEFITGAKASSYDSCLRLQLELQIN